MFITYNIGLTKFQNDLQKYLIDNGIGTLIHYPIPPHLQLAYQQLGFKKSDLPIAEEGADMCLSLVLWPGMLKNQVERITSLIKKFYK